MPLLSIPKDLDKKRLALALLSFLAYLATFFALFYLKNAGMAILTIIPAATIGWLYGAVPGMIAGLLSLPLNICIYEILGIDWIQRIRHGALLQGSFAIVFIAMVLGRVSDLSRRLRKELSEKGAIEEALRLHRANLEEEVQEKTAELKAAYQKLWQANEQLEEQYQQLRASQAELKASREFLETVISNSTDGIIITDAQGEIILVNRPVGALFGRATDDLIGAPLETLLLADKAMKARGAQLTKEFMSNGHATYEMTLASAGGEPVHLECTITLIKNAAGELIASMNIMRDVTGRKRMEQQVRQSQKIEAIGTLAGGIAHDFNNILAAIIGYTELTQVLAARDDRIRRNLDQVLKASERARNLVRQILSFSRKAEPERKPLMPHAVVREVMELLRATVPATIEIHTDIPDLQSVIFGDATELHQVVMNLCTNAVHAMEGAGGTLAVTLAPAFISPAEATRCHDIAPGQYMKLTVSDTGTGIAPAIIDRIFDPFFTTKEIDRGTGMGLAVVHGIVKSYGGDISIESRQGRGTAVAVLFPVAEQGHAEDSPVQSPVTGSGSILLVDDEEAIVESTREMLASLGYRVTGVLDPARALKIFKNDPRGFDLVITDQTMPGMTGVDLAREILAARPSIPVLLCTGFSEAVDEAKAKAVGMRGVFMKPTGMVELSRLIRDALVGVGP